MTQIKKLAWAVKNAREKISAGAFYVEGIPEGMQEQIKEMVKSMDEMYNELIALAKENGE